LNLATNCLSRTKPSSESFLLSFFQKRSAFFSVQFNLNLSPSKPPPIEGLAVQTSKCDDMRHAFRIIQPERQLIRHPALHQI
jgi:hypothetical protein